MLIFFEQHLSGIIPLFWDAGCLPNLDAREQSEDADMSGLILLPRVRLKCSFKWFPDLHTIYFQLRAVVCVNEL